MATMRWLAFILVVVVAIPASAARPPDPVALVADVEGAVLATHAGDSPAVVDLFSSIPAGAVLTVPDGARISVVYFGGRQFDYTGPDSVTVGKDAPTSLSGAEADAAARPRSATGLTPDDVRQLVLASLEVRGASVRRRIQLRHPVGTVVTRKDPVFSWAQLEPGATYRFVLRDEGGRELWQTQTQETRLQLPWDVVLEDGEVYGWLVEARGSSGKDFSATAEFRVASASQRGQLAQLQGELGGGDTSDRVLYALMLQKLGMEDAAAVTLQELAKARPQSPQLQRISARAAEAVPVSLIAPSLPAQ